MRTFGIELEIITPAGTSGHDVAAIITAAGVRGAFESYNHHTRRHWKVVTDQSVHGTDDVQGYGYEVVSPVLRGEDGIAEARKVAAALTAAGFKVNKTCGFHVHVGANDLNVKQMAGLALRWLHTEYCFDAVMPKSRRGNANGYCRTNLTQPIEVMERRLKEATHVDQIIRIVNPGNNRYYKLNMTSFYRQQTVEFRHHSGTIDADKIEHWVRVCIGLVNEAAKDETAKIIRIKLAKPAAQGYRVGSAAGLYGTATADFFKARAQQFAREDKAPLRQAA